MTDKLLDRIQGSVVGFVIGDAIAAPVEFTLDPTPVTDYQPAYRKGLKRGQYTDDAQHLMLSLDSLLENHGDINLEDISKRLIQWYDSGKARSIGRTTELAVQNLKQGVSPTRSGINNPHACGSLGLARLIPYCLHSALLPYEQKLTTADEKRILGITHAHKKVFGMGGLLHYYIQEMAHDRTAEATTFQIIDEDEFSNRRTRRKLGKVLSLAQSEIDPTSAIGVIGNSGYIKDVLYSAIYSVLKAQNFRESVLYAANGFGDADSRASIAGALAGLQYGYSGIPNHLLRDLEDHELLKEKAQQLYRISKRN